MRERTTRRRKERAAKTASTPPKTKSAALSAVLGLLLVVGTILLYRSVSSHEFLNYDDRDYVLDNPHVTGGLTWQTARWSLTATEQSNWHPLTWLSHALDCQLFGLDPGYHHITNLAIHAVNVLLLFLLLKKATGSPGRSFLVAALFAWHPFNVQSVAWVAERKNLLSTLFLLLTLGAYTWYAQKPRWKRFAIVAGIFVLALASKPMTVTLPFLLLLLDYWPLQRVAGWINVSPRLSIPQQSIRQLVLEKLPLFALSAASSVITVWAQRSGGAMRSLQLYPFAVRFANALHSYAIYIWKTFWPSGFAVYYPLPGTALPVWKPALAALILCAISVIAWRQRKGRPYLLVGWLWFVGTLVPVIGIIQVGDQAMADRYAYLPLIGLFVALIWGAADLLESLHVGTLPRCALATLALAVFCWLTSQQLGYWQNSVTIWSRTLEITNGDLQVEKQLANALVTAGETQQVLPHLINITRRDPNDTTDHANLGACYAALGQTEDAMQEFQKVVQLTDHSDLSPDDRKVRSSAFLNLGFAYAHSKDYRTALTNFQGATASDSSMVDQLIAKFEGDIAAAANERSYLNLSLLLRAEGKDSQASSLLEDAIHANPDYVNSRDLLNYLNTDPKVKEYSSGRGPNPQPAT
jgi:Tfp pilus assembly protein PilF